MSGIGFPTSNPLLPNGQFSQEWRRFLLNVSGQAFSAVTSVSIVPANGISGTVTNPTTTPAISLALGNITPTSIAATGPVSGTNLSGTNTGDQTIALSGDAAGSGTGAITVAVSKIGGKAVSLAGNLTTVGAFASTFTMTGVTSVTFPTAGTLATQAGAETLTNKTINNPVGTMTLASGQLGYAAGNGGTVTQTTNKATAVTLNKMSGDITLNAAALASGATVSFILNNTNIAATDLVIAQHNSVGTNGAYDVLAQVSGLGSSALISVTNRSAGSLSEAIVIRFVVFKAANT